MLLWKKISSNRQENVVEETVNFLPVCCQKRRIFFLNKVNPWSKFFPRNLITKFARLFRPVCILRNQHCSVANLTVFCYRIFKSLKGQIISIYIFLKAKIFINDIRYGNFSYHIFMCWDKRAYVIICNFKTKFDLGSAGFYKQMYEPLRFPNWTDVAMSN